MQTTQIIKLVLAAAIVVVLFRLVVAPARRGAEVQPYAFQRYEGYNDEEDMEADEDAEEEEDDEYDSDGDYEDDEDDEEDEVDDGEDDDEDGDEDGEEDEDEEDGDEDEEEGFAVPAAPEPVGMPLMNVATDLLPKPVSNDNGFGEFAPKSLLGQNFLDAKKYIGVDTQGSSLRNANYDLRASPAIPRRDIGPWSQSTIDSDLYRKPLE